MRKTKSFASVILVFLLSGCASFFPTSDYGTARSIADLNPLPPERLPMWTDGFSLPQFSILNKPPQDSQKKGNKDGQNRKDRNNRPPKDQKDKPHGLTKMAVDFWKGIWPTLDSEAGKKNKNDKGDKKHNKHKNNKDLS